VIIEYEVIAHIISERDGKSSKFMVILELLTWKLSKDLNRPLTY
jgi:hypothetical protein